MRLLIKCYNSNRGNEFHSLDDSGSFRQASCHVQMFCSKPDLRNPNVWSWVCCTSFVCQPDTEWIHLDPSWIQTLWRHSLDYKFDCLPWTQCLLHEGQSQANTTLCLVLCWRCCLSNIQWETSLTVQQTGDHASMRSSKQRASFIWGFPIWHASFGGLFRGHSGLSRVVCRMQIKSYLVQDSKF